MQYLVGLQMPREFKAQAEEFCGRYSYTLRSLYITLLSPSTLGNLIGIEQKLTSFCLSQPVLPVTLSDPMLAAGGKALCFPVMPGQITLMRVRLLRHLGLDMCAAAHHAPLTLMQRQKRWSMNLEPVLQDAGSFFTTPITLQVDSLTLYSSSAEGQALTQQLTIPFTGR